MKKFIFGCFALCLCCVLCLGVTPLYADFDTFTLSNIEPISITIDQDTEANISRIRFSNNSLFIIDSVNNKIYQANDNMRTVYDDTDAPYDITQINDEQLVSTKTVFIKHFDNEGTMTEINKFINEGNTYSALPSPQTFATDATGNTYLINNNTILRYNADNQTLSWFATLSYLDSPLNFAQGGFCITENGEALYFTIADKIYKLSTQAKTISTVAASQSFTDIKYLNADNLGNIYVLDGSTLLKIYNDEVIASANLDSSIQNIELDYLHGTIYYFTTDNKLFVAQLLNDANQTNFITNYSEIAPNASLADLQPSTSVFSAVQTTQTTHLYEYQTLLSPAHTYTENKKLIVLDASNPSFYYVYDNNYDNEQGFTTGYVLKSSCEILANSYSEEFREINTAKVITGYSRIFCMPISLPIAQDTFVPNLGTLRYGEIITIVASPQIAPNSNNVSFVAIKITKDDTEYYGYIDSSTILAYENSSSSTEVNLVPNATTRVETVVYQEKNCENEIDTLAKDCPVKIISTLGDVSKIEYCVTEGENQIIKTGYVKSSFLNDGTLTTTQILGFVLMIVSIIITIVVIVAYSKRKKKLRNQIDEEPLPTLPNQDENIE